MDSHIIDYFNACKVTFNPEKTESPIPLEWVQVFYKRYPRFPSIPLSPQTSSLEELAKQRKSTRVFIDRPLSFAKMSTLLQGSAGRIEEITGAERSARRVYPSAGARYPLEVYIAAFNVERLLQGWYHYNLIDATLEQLHLCPMEPVSPWLFGGYLTNPAAGIVITSAITRNEIKYGVHALRFSLLEAGHIGQMIYLQGVEQDLGVCSTGGFDTEKVISALDLSREELPLYVLGLGEISPTHTTH
jgi:SagB-type dehydrogenase family enzyme